MFTHRITVTLKSDASLELTHVADEEVIPPLHHHKGSCGEVISITAERSRAASGGYREMNDNACHHNEHQESLAPSVDVVVGLPKIGTFEGSSSTFLKIAA